MQLVLFVISAFFSDYIIIMYGLMFIIIIHMYIQYKHYSLLLEDKGTFSIIIIITLIMLMLSLIHLIGIQLIRISGSKQLQRF